MDENGHRFILSAIRGELLEWERERANDSKLSLVVLDKNSTKKGGKKSEPKVNRLIYRNLQNTNLEKRTKLSKSIATLTQIINFNQFGSLLNFLEVWYDLFWL